jgi:carbonic anhydrase/acetyltransferase-like protein (isoleucine patch superfamily)
LSSERYTGIIDGYKNLSQLGESKVEDGGKAIEESFVSEHAVIHSGGVAKGKARIFGEANVHGSVQAYCQVSGEAYIGKKAQLGQVIEIPNKDPYPDGKVVAMEYAKIFSGLIVGNVLIGGNAIIGDSSDENTDSTPESFALIHGHDRVYKKTDDTTTLYTEPLVAATETFEENDSVAIMDGYVRIYGEALIGNTARVSGFARISGKAKVYGTVRGHARVYGNAEIQEGAIVEGNARVAGDAVIPAGVTIKGNARITGCPKITVEEGGELVLDEDAVLSTKAVVSVPAGETVTISDQSAMPYNCANLSEYGGETFSRPPSYSGDGNDEVTAKQDPVVWVPGTETPKTPNCDTETKASKGCGWVRVLFVEKMQLDDEILITGDNDFLEKLNAVD